MAAKKKPAVAGKPQDSAHALYVLGNLTRAQWQDLQDTIPLSVERLIAGIIDAGLASPPRPFL